MCVIMYAVCPVKAKLQNVDLSDIYFEGRGQQQSTVYAEGDGEVKEISFTRVYEDCQPTGAGFQGPRKGICSPTTSSLVCVQGACVTGITRDQ